METLKRLTFTGEGSAGDFGRPPFPDAIAVSSSSIARISISPGVSGGPTSAFGSVILAATDAANLSA
jgi:hypothetical protein